MVKPNAELWESANARIRETYGPTWSLERNATPPGRGTYLCNWGVRVAASARGTPGCTVVSTTCCTPTWYSRIEAATSCGGLFRPSSGEIWGLIQASRPGPRTRRNLGAYSGRAVHS